MALCTVQIGHTGDIRDICEQTKKEGSRVIKKYHDPILREISDKGALGVNALAKLTDLPLSTVQKYLTTQQTYFRKTSDRKWDLPERVNTDITSNSLQRSASLLDNTLVLLQNQLEEMGNTLASLAPVTNMIKRALENNTLPVADNSSKLTNRKVKEMFDSVDKLPEVIKNKKKNISEELYEMLINTDWLSLWIDYGTNYVSTVIQDSLYDLLLGKTDELSEDALDTIKSYQTE